MSNDNQDQDLEGINSPTRDMNLQDLVKAGVVDAKHVEEVERGGMGDADRARPHLEAGRLIDPAFPPAELGVTDKYVEQLAKADSKRTPAAQEIADKRENHGHGMGPHGNSDRSFLTRSSSVRDGSHVKQQNRRRDGMDDGVIKYR